MDASLKSRTHFLKKVVGSKRRSAPLYPLGWIGGFIPKIFFEGWSIFPEAVTRITDGACLLSRGALSHETHDRETCETTPNGSGELLRFILRRGYYSSNEQRDGRRSAVHVDTCARVTIS
jgi:hypothetical protein